MAKFPWSTGNSNFGGSTRRPSAMDIGNTGSQGAGMSRSGGGVPQPVGHVVKLTPHKPANKPARSNTGRRKKK